MKGLKISETLCTIYMMGILGFTLISYAFTPSLTVHGRSAAGISKFYYFILYMTAVIMLIGSNNAFIIHPARRFIETVVYSWNSKSKMSFLHLIHGLLYFIVLSLYLYDKPIEPLGFFIVNLIQAVAHYRVYYLKIYEFSHYYTEILVYGYIFLCVSTPAMFFNLLYIFAFVYVTISNRLNEKRI